jgi:hypothetical protein
MHWLSENYKWLFDGIGGLALMAVIGYFTRRILRRSPDHQKDIASLNAQGAKVTNSPVASGSNISQNINSPTLNLSLSAKMPTADEDQSNWPDVILVCQWPSLVHESKIPGSHIVRKRPWMLRYRGPGAVYNVCVHRIDFGEYEASFPFRAPTLIDTASVHPIICHKSDGLVITTHDLESLIQNPPSGCDVQQYAVQTDGNEGEEIPLEALVLELEIPVTISYEDKNGNQFKIRYLLHYDTYMEKGEMMRIGRIEKVAPIATE